MGNVCQGDARPELQLDPQYNTDENRLLTMYPKDLPSSNYAIMKGKIGRLPLVQHVLGEQLGKRPLQNPERRGNPLPMHFIHQRNMFYDGEWSGGRPNGLGRVHQTNGSYFQGSFINGQAEGRDGILVYPDGSYYRGSFANSQINGRGIFYYHYNGLIYEGEWRDGRPHGQGEERFRDGSSYKGTFRDGLKDGPRGVFKWADGKRYQGEFREGYMDGQGVLTNTRGKGEFRGIFRRNLKQEGNLKTEFGTYQGQFLNGEMHGPGRFYWDDKKVYEGGFFNGNLHGQGLITYPTGQKARGVWNHGENVKIEDIQHNMS